MLRDVLTSPLAAQFLDICDHFFIIRFLQGAITLPVAPTLAQLIKQVHDM